MLTGLLEPSSGSVQILGQPFTATSLDVKRQIGVVPEGMALLGRLTAPEYLRFVGRMYGLDRETTNRRTDELLEFMQLANESRKLVTDFSHGMQKKLALAAAVIHGPKVLFLDEPFEGVDAIAAGMLKTMLQGMIQRGATIFLTTHVLEIVERLCSHVAIISKGQLVANGSMEELSAGRGQHAAGRGERAKADARRDVPVDCGRGRHGAGSGAVMAGVAESLPGHVGTGMFSALARMQYAALARMRWSMFRNGVHSRKGAIELGANIGMTLLYSVMGLGMAFGLGAGAFQIASGGNWKFLPILFWIVCFLWQIVPVSMASFQQQFDPGGLLRFPVSFGGFYLLHLIFGLVDASTIMGAFCCTGLLIGVSVVRPDLFGWMALALIVFAAFNVFLVRAIFAWIDRWLAQRRTREILTAVFFAALLAMQLLNPALGMVKYQNPNSAAAKVVREHRAVTLGPWINRAVEVQRWLPPGLAASMVEEAQADKPAQSLASLALLGIFVLGTGGVLAARLRSEYRGESLGEAPARKEAQRRRGAWLIDGSGPMAAVMEKELRTLMRAMPFLYSLGAPLLMVFVFSSMFRTHHSITKFPIALLLFLAYGLVGFTQLLYNNLGGEGAGIQFLFLSPTPIRTVILAKNLFHSGLFAVEAVIICAISAWRFGLPEPVALAAMLCWLLFAMPAHLAAGNLFSAPHALPHQPWPDRAAARLAGQRAAEPAHPGRRAGHRRRSDGAVRVFRGNFGWPFPSL